MKQKFISEVLGGLKNFTGPGSQAKKIEYLQKNASPTLLFVLRMAYDDRIKWTLPEGVPKHKSSGAPIDYNFGSLHTEQRKLSYLWLTPESGGKVMNMTKIRSETLFIQLLENLHEDEAAIVIAMKDHNLHKLYPLTKDVVRKAFPTLLPEEKEAEPVTT